MKPFLVTYDLDKPGQNYDSLIARLKEHRAVRVELSVWALGSTWTAAQLRDDLKTLMDANDRLLVVQISGDWAYSNILGPDRFKEIAA